MKSPFARRTSRPLALVVGLGGLITFVDTPAAETWASTPAPTLIWNAVASSADGSTLLAASGSLPYATAMPLFVSTNTGATWTKTRSPGNRWTTVCSSADGTRLAAAACSFCPLWVGGDGLIYTSPDSGLSWTPTSAPSNTWTSIASSADGRRLVAVAAPTWRIWSEDDPPHGQGVIVRSVDSGTNWAQASAPTNFWTSVASSADGARIVAVSGHRWNEPWQQFIGDGGVYRSVDSGATWIRTSAPTNFWTAVSCSADATTLVAVAGTYYEDAGEFGDGGMYRSLDAGTTWRPIPNFANNWTAVTCSADGTRMKATTSEGCNSCAGGDGLIYTSDDSGGTWTPDTEGAESWHAVTSSADGYRVVAAGYSDLVTLPYSGPWSPVKAPDLHWQGAAVSSDGTRWVGVGTVSPYQKDGGRFYVSHDSGTTWPPGGHFVLPWNWTSLAALRRWYPAGRNQRRWVLLGIPLRLSINGFRGELDAHQHSGRALVPGGLLGRWAAHRPVCQRTKSQWPIDLLPPIARSRAPRATFAPTGCQSLRQGPCPLLARPFDPVRPPTSRHPGFRNLVRPTRNPDPRSDQLASSSHSRWVTWESLLPAQGTMTHAVTIETPRRNRCRSQLSPTPLLGATPVMKTQHLAASLLATLLSASTGHAAALIEFPFAKCTVSEGCGRMEVAVTRTNDLDTAVSVDLATVPGSAVPDLDYLTVATNLTFAPGETRRTVLVPIVDDGRVETYKTFNVSLSAPQGGAQLGSRTNLKVTLLDNDKGLHVYAPSISVNADAGLAVIKVARGNDGDNVVSVDYATSDGTAKVGQRYIATAGTLTFAPGEVLKSIPVPLRSGNNPLPSQTFLVTLSNPTGDGVVSQPSATTVTISGAGARVHLDSIAYSVREHAASLPVHLARARSELPGTVTLATSDATATSGLDYLGVTNTVHFAAGERDKRVDIPILWDALQEVSRNFRIQLSQPTGDMTLVTPYSASVTLVKSSTKVGFTRAQFAVPATADIARLVVERGEGEPLGTLIVAYRTTDGSAQAGLDYIASTGTLEFTPHQTLQEIAVPLLRNPKAVGKTDFSVTLTQTSDESSPSIPSATVRIFHAGMFYPLTPGTHASFTWFREEETVKLGWTGEGTLQRAEQATGPWSVVAGAGNAYVFTPSMTAGFFRLKSQRSAEVYVPKGYDGRTPLPLVLMLHAHGFDGNAVRTAYMDLNPVADEKGFLVCYPNGVGGAWMGPDFLDFYGSSVDDSTYLRGVIEEIMSLFRVDPKRIFSTGPSSGGAMSHRLGCDHADLIAAIAPISGRTYYSPDDCHPSEPVSVLQNDGSEDGYADGFMRFGLPVIAEIPGAIRTVQNWAQLNGCQDPVMEAGLSLDVESDFPGVDTTVLRFTRCPPGGSVELWTVNGGGHVATGSDRFRGMLIDWLFAHPKP